MVGVGEMEAGRGMTAGPSTAPLAIKLREASLRMAILIVISYLPESNMSIPLAEAEDESRAEAEDAVAGMAVVPPTVSLLTVVTEP